ncbi:hypothetical protein [Paraburkholderia piptadeniae]|nr:hypothetical protein [Paraburkholderia piptadeniae]
MEQLIACLANATSVATGAEMSVANGFGDALRDARGRRRANAPTILARVKRRLPRFSTTDGLIDDVVPESVAQRPDELGDFRHRMGGRLADAGIHFGLWQLGDVYDTVYL